MNSLLLLIIKMKRNSLSAVRNFKEKGDLLEKVPFLQKFKGKITVIGKQGILNVLYSRQKLKSQNSVSFTSQRASPRQHTQSAYQNIEPNEQLKPINFQKEYETLAVLRQKKQRQPSLKRSKITNENQTHLVLKDGLQLPRIKTKMDGNQACHQCKYKENQLHKILLLCNKPQKSQRRVRLM